MIFGQHDRIIGRSSLASVFIFLLFTVFGTSFNLRSSGSSVSVAGGMVNAGGVLWWPGK